ncbi:MAG: phosphoribosyl-ATP diphosphatase [Candidatus Hodarchaeaceae archaeon]|nr:phosphoribosyl-ATP diphosphatase [Candidatus Hodarchaeaceae archaeon]
MGTEILDEVFAVVEDRRDNPKKGSYTSRLLASGKVLEKLDEEAGELAEAAEGKNKKAIVHEAADLIFHILVVLAAKGVKLEEVMEELRRRRR